MTNWNLYTDPDDGKQYYEITGSVAFPTGLNPGDRAFVTVRQPDDGVIGTYMGVPVVESSDEVVNMQGQVVLRDGPSWRDLRDVSERPVTAGYTLEQVMAMRNQQYAMPNPLLPTPLQRTSNFLEGIFEAIGVFDSTALSMRAKTWLPGDDDKPEPPPPPGRFQNLEWDEHE